ncbi:hypothetical protein MNV49_000922 [Pseudohyphozyma bogoriensis]|nr:hypothetical protein MNV49_000922 [Pseudohyphozyma bogoriensis]
MPPSPTLYSDYYWKPVTFMVDLGALVVMAVLTALRMPRWKQWRTWQVHPAKAALVMALTNSTLFIYASTFLVFGVGTTNSEAACQFAMWMCFTLYSGAKVFTTFFLIERCSAPSTIENWSGSA